MKNSRDMMAAYLLYRCKHLCMLKFPVVHMGVGRGDRGSWPTLDFEIISKNVVFSIWCGKS